MYDLFAGGVEHNTKRVILAGGVWKYLGTSLLPRRLYTGGWKSVDWQVYDNLKQQPKQLTSHTNQVILVSYIPNNKSLLLPKSSTHGHVDKSEFV